MASFNSIEGIVIRRLGGSAVRTFRMRTGRYSYELARGEETVEQGRCHVFVGEDGVSLVEPQRDDCAVIDLDAIESVELENPLFGRPKLWVYLVGDAYLRLSDTMRGPHADSLTKSLQMLIPRARPLMGLKFFQGQVESARNGREISQKRDEAAKRGELFEADGLKALKEPVVAQANCITLGSVVPPDPPEGPAFHGLALVGATQIGFINPARSTTVAWYLIRFSDITTVAYRREHSDSLPDTYLFEIVTNEGKRPSLKLHGDYVRHIAFRVPAPTTEGVANVASLILSRSRELSRFEVSIGSEGESIGLALLPITAQLDEDNAQS